MCEPILATATLRYQLHGQVAGAMSILAPCANRTKARPCRSYQDRSTAGRLLLSGESFECLHPSFLTARHLCCTRPPDCHVCRSQPRNKRDRRTSFQRRAQLSYIHGSFEDRIPERLGPRPSTDRTPDTSVQQLSQLIQPPKPTPSFAGFSRLEDLRRSYIFWRTFARVSLTADAANHTPAISLDLGRPTSSRRQLS